MDVHGIPWFHGEHDDKPRWTMNDEPSIFLGNHIFTWSAKPFFVRACEFGREWLWRVTGWRVLRGVAACATRSLPKKKGWVRPQKQGSPKTKVSNMFYIWCTIFFPSFPMPRAWGMMSSYLLTSHVGHLISSFRCTKSFWVVGSSTGWICVHWCAATIYIYIARVWQLWYIMIYIYI